MERLGWFVLAATERGMRGRLRYSEEGRVSCDWEREDLGRGELVLDYCRGCLGGCLVAEGGKMEMTVVVGHEREPGKSREEENQELEGATTLFGRDGSRIGQPEIPSGDFL
ncbi:hypothetical protein NC652_027715 [Populus alba x Populus x berolinensis]|nr:hypothetical protein NC652_027715 [Populus alba x Populus x berolinensis]